MNHLLRDFRPLPFATVAMTALLLVGCFDTQPAPTAMDSGAVTQMTDPPDADTNTVTRTTTEDHTSASSGASGGETATSSVDSTTPEQSTDAESMSTDTSSSAGYDDTDSGTSDGTLSSADPNEDSTSETAASNATSSGSSSATDGDGDGGASLTDSGMDGGADGGDADFDASFPECVPGAMRDCNDCGTQTCGTEGTWQSCLDPEPESATVACQRQGAACGVVTNACGESVSCPDSCGSEYTCDGNECRCLQTPAEACAAAEAACGFVGDECGDPVACGSCDEGRRCTGNECVCDDPNVCNDVQCGSVTNACAEVIECPNTCKSSHVCADNRCECSQTDAQACAAAGAACGSVTNECGETVSCTNTCAPGAACVDNACACPNPEGACVPGDCSVASVASCDPVNGGTVYVRRTCSSACTWVTGEDCCTANGNSCDHLCD